MQCRRRPAERNELEQIEQLALHASKHAAASHEQEQQQQFPYNTTGEPSPREQSAKHEPSPHDAAVPVIHSHTATVGHVELLAGNLLGPQDQRAVKELH